MGERLKQTTVATTLIFANEPEVPMQNVWLIEKYILQNSSRNEHFLGWE